MTCKNIYMLLLCATLISCASTRPKEFTDYQAQLIAPVTAEEFILKEKKVFDDPALGAMLSYINRDFPEDNITVYVYPINATSWEDSNETLTKELKNALRDVDAAVHHGYYQSRSAETIKDIIFKENNIEYVGKSAEFNLTTKQGIDIYSNVYLFIDQDKYIKFRTSYDSRLTNVSMGDDAVHKLLPQMVIPPESIYMKNIREAHDKKRQEQLMQLIMQAMETQKQ